MHLTPYQNGIRKGLESFYMHLPLLNMRCDLDPSRVAVWWSDEQASISPSMTNLLSSYPVIYQCLKLSAFAAQTLADAKLISLQTLKLHRRLSISLLGLDHWLLIFFQGQKNTNFARKSLIL